MTWTEAKAEAARLFDGLRARLSDADLRLVMRALGRHYQKNKMKTEQDPNPIQALGRAFRVFCEIEKRGGGNGSFERLLATQAPRPMTLLGQFGQRHMLYLQKLEDEERRKAEDQLSTHLSVVPPDFPDQLTTEQTGQLMLAFHTHGNIFRQ